MARKEMTRMRFEEVKRLINLGTSDRKIARSIKCTRRTVQKIRNGEIIFNEPKEIIFPQWTENLDWGEVAKNYREGFELKYIWEEKASDVITYVNFWKQFYRKFPQYRTNIVTRRFFKPGEHCEVDYAGDKKIPFSVEWTDTVTGEIHKVEIFIGVLCFSQYIFANAKVDAKSQNFLESHAEMYQHFGGVPLVTVSDCLRQGVNKCHLYDPDINVSYKDLAEYFRTAIVPARPMHPKDKAIVEIVVKILMRYFKWLYRKHKFTSLGEINTALQSVVDLVNKRKHTRFKISRHEMWEKYEKSHLRALPETPYEYSEWREARVHPDCHVSVDHAYYSVPHIHRGKKVRVKLSKNNVEIFLNMERICIHPRDRNRRGVPVTILDHLPPASRAYHEATPQHLLSEAKYLNEDLFMVVNFLFEKDTIPNIRRVQGLNRTAKKEIEAIGAEEASINITRACETMMKVLKIRVPYFKELLTKFRKEKLQTCDRNILRKPNNPMIRSHYEIFTTQ